MSDAIRKGVVVTPEDFRGFDWLAEMRTLGLDTLGVHNGGGVGDRLTERLGDTFSKAFRQAAVENNVQVEYELHASSTLMPRSLFDVHPDYFRMPQKSRERSPDFNWCASSPQGRGVFAANAKEVAALLEPDTHRHFFWSDDNRGWCHCDACRHLSDADQELEAANIIAKALREDDPHAQVAFLAYGQTFRPPVEVKPSGNVFLEYAPIQRCYRHAIDDSSCVVNRDCWRILLSLLEIFPADTTHVLEYWLDSSLYSAGKKPAVKPLFIPAVVKADLAAYHGLGIRSFTTFAVFMDGDYFVNHGKKELLEYADLLNEL